MKSNGTDERNLALGVCVSLDKAVIMISHSSEVLVCTLKHHDSPKPSRRTRSDILCRTSTL